MNALKEWWDGASPRDQLAVMVLGFCALVYVLYMLIYSPVNNMRDAQIRKNNSAMESQLRVREMAAQVTQQAGGATGSKNKSVVELVSRSLGVNKLVHSGMQPNGNNNIRLRFEKVPFERIVSWLHTMEVGEGLIVNDISVSSSNEPGLVSVNVRLSRP